MKKYIFLLLSFPFTMEVCAQYYYKDIVSNVQAKAELNNLKDRKIKEVKIFSYEDDGKPSKGFFCERKLSKDFKLSTVFTRTSAHPPSLTTTVFDSQGKLIYSSDSSEISTTHIKYAYDEDGRLLTIESTVKSSDDDFVSEINEQHIYIYSEDFYPDKMVRVINKRDSSTILFSKDEAGNISIEKNTKSGNKYFYYYDSKSRLTDIVHHNEYTEKLIPDYMFEYNDEGNISQMISTEEGGSYYFVWKYSYENGLRKREDCYSKQRLLLGTIKYEYR